MAAGESMCGVDLCRRISVAINKDGGSVFPTYFDTGKCRLGSGRVGEPN